MKDSDRDSSQQFHCPKCGSLMHSFRMGLHCPDKQCGFWVPRSIRQKMLTPVVVHQLLTNRKTDVIPGFQKRGNNQIFSASLYISDNWKIKLRVDGESNIVCPRCKSFFLRRTEQGYACLNEQRCGFVLWEHFGGKKLTQQQMLTILIERKTELINGFISKKNGTSFSARLILNDKAQLQFLFDSDKRRKEPLL